MFLVLQLLNLCNTEMQYVNKVYALNRPNYMPKLSEMQRPTPSSCNAAGQVRYLLCILNCQPTKPFVGRKGT